MFCFDKVVNEYMAFHHDCCNNVAKIISASEVTTSNIGKYIRVDSRLLNIIYYHPQYSKKRMCFVMNFIYLRDWYIGSALSNHSNITCCEKVVILADIYNDLLCVGGTWIVCRHATIYHKTMPRYNVLSSSYTWVAWTLTQWDRDKIATMMLLQTKLLIYFQWILSLLSNYNFQSIN